ncbi:uncharacterized protein [Drosophila takahashii]|uniref:uncharacterized protein n=1 Tax=Drosophila takahashii TaxID=29030 RepID=UPI001CF85184|nr:uncharacterized protein LOC108067527 [Drosophila takahashii]
MDNWPIYIRINGAELSNTTQPEKILFYIYCTLYPCVFLFGRVKVKIRVGGDEPATTMRAIFSRGAGGTFKMALPGDPRRST